MLFLTDFIFAANFGKVRYKILGYLSAILMVFLGGFFAYANAAETDTLSLTLSNADSLFQAQNLELLANHMNIDIAAAQVIAAKIWDNPVFYSEVNVWNPLSKKPFDVANGGQLYLQVQQLFKIGGEHHRLAQYNKANKAATEYAYFDLLRNLRYELHTNFFQLNSLLKTKQSYLVEIEKAQNLEKALNEEYSKSNVSLKDLVRIQSSLFQLQADYTQLQNQISDLQSKLHQMLRTPVSQFITPSLSNELEKDYTSLNLDTLYSLALSNRADLKADETQITAAEWNLKYQRSLAVPDLTVGFDYFNNGAASFNNYYGLQLSMPLPVFNRNQGGIKAAKANLQQQKYQAEGTKDKTINEVNAAYAKLLQAGSIDLNDQRKKNEGFDKLMANILSLYVRKEISLKDLGDYMDLYKSQSKAFYDYMAQYQTAREELNFAVGKPVLK